MLSRGGAVMLDAKGSRALGSGRSRLTRVSPLAFPLERARSYFLSTLIAATQVGCRLYTLPVGRRPALFDAEVAAEVRRTIEAAQLGRAVPCAALRRVFDKLRAVGAGDYEWVLSSAVYWLDFGWATTLPLMNMSLTP